MVRATQSPKFSQAPRLVAVILYVGVFRLLKVSPGRNKKTKNAETAMKGKKIKFHPI